MAFHAGYLTLARRYPSKPIPGIVELCPPNDRMRDFLNSMYLNAVHRAVLQCRWTYDVWASLRALLSLDVEVIKSVATTVLRAVATRESFQIANKACLQIVLTSPFARNSSLYRQHHSDVVAVVAALSESGARPCLESKDGGGPGRTSDLVVSWKDDDDRYCTTCWR
jgi:hypothetical protein